MSCQVSRFHRQLQGFHIVVYVMSMLRFLVLMSTTAGLLLGVTFTHDFHSDLTGRTACFAGLVFGTIIK